MAQGFRSAELSIGIARKAPHRTATAEESATFCGTASALNGIPKPVKAQVLKGIEKSVKAWARRGVARPVKA